MVVMAPYAVAVAMVSVSMSMMTMMTMIMRVVMRVRGRPVGVMMIVSHDRFLYTSAVGGQAFEEHKSLNVNV